MATNGLNTRRSRARRLLIGVALAIAVFAATTAAANAAVSATFHNGTLTVFGDGYLCRLLRQSA